MTRAAKITAAVFGALLNGVFAGELNRRLDRLDLAPDVGEQIAAQRSKLAAAQTDDPRARQAIKEAFVSGYQVVLWVAAGLALASSLSAAVLIESEKRSEHS